MRITSKGQVTIPQHIRAQAGLLPMTEVAFAIEDGVVTLRPAPPRDDAADRGAAGPRLMTEEIMALTRGA